MAGLCAPVGYQVQPIQDYSPKIVNFPFSFIVLEKWKVIRSHMHSMLKAMAGTEEML